MYELYGCPNDFRTQKIAIAAKYAGLELKISPKHIEEILKTHPQAKLPVLHIKNEGPGAIHNTCEEKQQTKDEFIFQSNAILRYIANCRMDSELYGKFNFSMGLVDQWLDFCWNEIEVASGVWIRRKELSATVPNYDQCEKRALDDLNKSLNIIEKHLVDRVFLVGEKITISDIAVVCALRALFESEFPSKEKSKFINIQRWMETCMNQPHFVTIFQSSSKNTSTKTSCKSECQKSKQTTSQSSSSVSLPTTLFDRKRLRIKDLLKQGLELVDTNVTIKGWAKTLREAGAGAFAFVEINDGSCFTGVQVIVTKGETEGFNDVLESGGVGASFQIEGVVVKSPAKGQVVEMRASKVIVLGKVHDNAKYPMSKKRHTLEHLRSNAHLRSRSNIHAAAMRLRNAMAFGIHQFFHDRGFLYIHTPLLTGADCEGAGEMFQVSTMFSKYPKGDFPKNKQGEIDFSNDFFHRPAYLTVSGQLNVETHCCGLGDCYTFGPTFRAENSNTTRHLAEFWMIEPEIAFADLSDDIDLAEDMLKYLTQYALDECMEDLEFFDKNVEKGLIKRLQDTISQPFKRISYTEAVELILQPQHLKKAKFEVVPKWGDDLGSEHERYITEKIFNKPVVIYNYPKGIKAFYMRLNDDLKTVAACDILVPKIGEIIGGSAREERLDVLRERTVEATGHDPDEYWWYNDLRKYGTIPHAGFGLGFERLVRFVTGIENIRDVIPFPRWPGNVEF